MVISWRAVEKTIWAATDATNHALGIVSERQGRYVLIAASGTQMGVYPSVAAAQHAFEAATEESRGHNDAESAAY